LSYGVSLHLMLHTARHHSKVLHFPTSQFAYTLH